MILVFDKGDSSNSKKFKIWNTDEFRKVLASTSSGRVSRASCRSRA